MEYRHNDIVGKVLRRTRFPADRLKEVKNYQSSSAIIIHYNDYTGRWAGVVRRVAYQARSQRGMDQCSVLSLLAYLVSADW